MLLYVSHNSPISITVYVYYQITVQNSSFNTSINVSSSEIRTESMLTLFHIKSTRVTCQDTYVLRDPLNMRQMNYNSHKILELNNYEHFSSCVSVFCSGFSCRNFLAETVCRFIFIHGTHHMLVALLLTKRRHTSGAVATMLLTIEPFYSMTVVLVVA